LADLILVNNREIISPQDDSVMHFTSYTDTKIIHRRARGLAPAFFYENNTDDSIILATGALLKSSFCLAYGGNTYISQYLGDTDIYETQLTYDKTVKHFLNLFDIATPDIVIADRHPEYYATRYAKEMSENTGAPFVMVQHHKAHFAAVLAENNLLYSDEFNKPILGIIWDGTGLGDDGNSWGGEFFTYHENQISRAAHFDYFPVIAGDKMAKEPRLSALAVATPSLRSDYLLKNKFTDSEWNFYQKALLQPSLQCSSVGRLFDAVASMLGLIDRQTYEGEAAMLLEEKARAYFHQNGFEFQDSYFIQHDDLPHIDTANLIVNITSDIKNGLAIDYITAKFHYSLVDSVRHVADQLEIKEIAFSGGVFQNGLLVDLCKLYLGSSYSLFFHKDLSPNDENISFGQFVYFNNNIDGIKESAIQSKILYHHHQS
jgi:hydrogenase maturation protein HypF